MKALFVATKDPFYPIELLSTFSLARDTNHIRKEAAIGVLSHFAHETLFNTPNSHMFAENSPALFEAFVPNQINQPWKILWS